MEQAVPVAATPADTWLTVFGPVRLMITRACPLSRWVGCGAHSTDDRCYETCVRDLPIEDAAGRKFRLVKRSWSWPELYGAEYATMPDAVRRLRGTVGRFILDLRTLPVHPLRTADKLEICRRFLGALRDDTAGAYGAGREETSERPDDRTFFPSPETGRVFRRPRSSRSPHVTVGLKPYSEVGTHEYFRENYESTPKRLDRYSTADFTRKDLTA